MRAVLHASADGRVTPYRHPHRFAPITPDTYGDGSGDMPADPWNLYPDILTLAPRGNIHGPQAFDYCGGMSDLADVLGKAAPSGIDDGRGGNIRVSRGRVARDSEGKPLRYVYDTRRDEEARKEDAKAKAATDRREGDDEGIATKYLRRVGKITWYFGISALKALFHAPIKTYKNLTDPQGNLDELEDMVKAVGKVGSELVENPGLVAEAVGMLAEDTAGEVVDTTETALFEQDEDKQAEAAGKLIWGSVEVIVGVKVAVGGLRRSPRGGYGPSRKFDPIPEVGGGKGTRQAFEDFLEEAQRRVARQKTAHPEWEGLKAQASSGAPSLDDLSKAAGAADRGGFTAAGRALQKHGGRPGSAFPAAQGNPSQINRAGQNIVDDILTSPGSTTTTRHHARFGDIIEIRAPDGRGVRFDTGGKFIGFLEP